MRALAVALALLLPAAALAQLRGIKADLTPLVESDAPSGTSVRAAMHVRLPEELHVQSNKPRDPSLIPTVLTIDAPAGVRVGEIVFPQPIDFEQVGQAEPLAVFGHEFLIGVRFDIESHAPAGPIEVPARLRYQACDENLCYAPATATARWTLTLVPAGAAVVRDRADVFDQIAFGTGEAPAAPASQAIPSLVVPRPGGLDGLETFSVQATTGGYLGRDDFLHFIRNAESGVKEKGLFDGRGPLAILLIVFLGGLALNLTPCVLPMIPINLAIIGAGTRAGSRVRGFLLGGVYGSAMALVYGALGLIVILTAGTFGTINASPWFNLAIAIVFTGLALAMFDVVTIDFSRYSSSIGSSAGRGSFLLAFGMGAVAALLAGACVAPVVIQVVLFSSDLYAQGVAVALALPFLLGVGMAVPWPIAGAGLAALPKPGAWMVRVKQAFGVLILATAVYYGYQAYMLFADRWVDAGEVASSVEEKLKAGWHASLTGGLAVAEREQKPVLVDLWATWCKNCLTMDKTTLADPAVEAALDGYVKIKFQAEQPDEEPARSVMRRFGAVGLPTYVILQPKTSATPF
ncbi:MAG: thioredoxin family protein [Vicinamibacterales bacterium]